MNVELVDFASVQERRYEFSAAVVQMFFAWFCPSNVERISPLSPKQRSRRRLVVEVDFEEHEVLQVRVEQALGSYLAFCGHQSANRRSCHPQNRIDAGVEHLHAVVDVVRRRFGPST